MGARKRDALGRKRCWSAKRWIEVGGRRRGRKRGRRGRELGQKAREPSTRVQRGTRALAEARAVKAEGHGCAAAQAWPRARAGGAMRPGGGGVD